MEYDGTLILNRGEIAHLLSMEECITAVEHAFKLYGEGKTMAPKMLGIPLTAGGFHIKAAVMELSKTYFVAKINANFPGNPAQFNLPTIQGIIAVSDGSNGRLLALMDSIEITIIRTGAATAIAAKYLALPDAKVATICGCGNQGRISFEALLKIRSLEKVFAFDIDALQARKLASEFVHLTEVIPITQSELSKSMRQSCICVTCTPSKKPFIRKEDIMPGTFIAAVGADNEEKQELYSDLLASNKIVADMAEQAGSIGELHHAIREGKISPSAIHAELGEIIAGRKPGRESKEEIIIFDSTGIALQDVAAASIVYEKAIAMELGIRMNFAENSSNA